jgi:hypothetical protein
MKQQTQVRRVMQDSIRMYFAPLTGAFKGIRAELHRADREVRRNRSAQSQAKKDAVHQA